MGKWLFLGGGIFAIAAAFSAAGKTPRNNHPVIYSTDDIYALSFHGVKLGMTFEAVCETLTQRGYLRASWDFPDDPPCSRKHLYDPDGKEDPDDYTEIYFGGVRDQKSQTDLRPIKDVKFFTITYLLENDVLRANVISVDTDEPEREEELAQRVQSEWGVPTAHNKWGYQVMTYAPSAKQADYDNRNDFSSCLNWSGCSESLTGPQCHSVLARYAVPFATQVIYDWGRHITIEDGHRSLAEAKRSGLLEKLLVKNTSYICPSPSVH